MWNCDLTWLLERRRGVVSLLLAFYAYVPAFCVLCVMGTMLQPISFTPLAMLPWLMVVAIFLLLRNEPVVSPQRRRWNADGSARLAVALTFAWAFLEFASYELGAYYRRLSVFRGVHVEDWWLDLGQQIFWVAWTGLVAAQFRRWARRLQLRFFPYVIVLNWVILAVASIGSCFIDYVKIFSSEYSSLLWDLDDFAHAAVFIGNNFAVLILVCFWIALNLAIKGIDLRLHRVRNVVWQLNEEKLVRLKPWWID